MSGRYNGGTRKDKPNIAPRIRASFLIAVKKLGQRKGKTFSELMAEWLDKDPIATLNVVSKFLSREERVRAPHDHALATASLPATQEDIASVVDQEGKTTEKANDNQPLVADPSPKYQ